MNDSQLEVTCACGWRTVGREDDVVAAATEHGVALHNMQVTREQVLAMSRPAPPPEPGDDAG